MLTFLKRDSSKAVKTPTPNAEKHFLTWFTLISKMKNLDQNWLKLANWLHSHIPVLCVCLSRSPDRMNTHYGIQTLILACRSSRTISRSRSKVIGQRCRSPGQKMFFLWDVIIVGNQEVTRHGPKPASASASASRSRLFEGQGFGFGFLDFWEPGFGFGFVILKGFGFGFGFAVYQSFNFANQSLLAKTYTSIYSDHLTWGHKKFPTKGNMGQVKVTWVKVKGHMGQGQRSRGSRLWYWWAHINVLSPHDSIRLWITLCIYFMSVCLLHVWMWLDQDAH